MNEGASRRGLQILLGVLATVMVVAGALTVIFGAEVVPREGVVTPDVDTEMRFYAIWYVIAGVILFRFIPRVESAGWVIRVVAAGFFAAGCARILSWAVVGRPNTFYIVLMVVELALPFVVVPWQAAVARRDHARS